MNSAIKKSQYEKVASIINTKLKPFRLGGLNPEIGVLERGSDGLVLIMNDDLYDLSNTSGYVEDLLYNSENTYVIGNHDLYLEPFDSLTFKLA